MVLVVVLMRLAVSIWTGEFIGRDSPGAPEQGHIWMNLLRLRRTAVLYLLEKHTHTHTSGFYPQR